MWCSLLSLLLSTHSANYLQCFFVVLCTTILAFFVLNWMLSIYNRICMYILYYVKCAFVQCRYVLRVKYRLNLFTNDLYYGTKMNSFSHYCKKIFCSFSLLISSLRTLFDVFLRYVNVDCKSAHCADAFLRIVHVYIRLSIAYLYVWRHLDTALMIH